MPRQGTGAAFLSAAAGKRGGQLLHLQQVLRGKGQGGGISPLPMLPHDRQVMGPAFPHTLGAGSSIPPPPELPRYSAGPSRIFKLVNFMLSIRYGTMTEFVM